MSIVDFWAINAV